MKIEKTSRTIGVTCDSIIGCGFVKNKIMLLKVASKVVNKISFFIAAPIQIPVTRHTDFYITIFYKT